MDTNIIGVLLFAAAMMFVYSWGYVKQQKTPEQMSQRLHLKTEKLILKNLQKSPQGLSENELALLVRGVRVFDFASRKILQVKDAKTFTKKILNNLLEKKKVSRKVYKKAFRYYIEEDGLSIDLQRNKHIK